MGAGINLFRQLFPEDYYAFQTATLISSKPVSKVIKDSNDQTIAEYPLGGDELRGLLKVENGNLVAYGDIKPSDGNGTEVFDIVDLGSLDYIYDGVMSGVNRFNALISGIKVDNVDVTSGLVCAEFLPDGSPVGRSGVDKTIAHYNSRIYINDNFYNDAATFKTAMSGKYLIYEKATPTAKSYTPFTNPMISGSTEEFTDSRSLKMFVGHDSLYYTSNFKYW